MPGIKGQKWGVRRFQNEDGTLTEEGKRRYGETDSHTGGKDVTEAKKEHDRKMKEAAKDAEEYARAKAYYGEGAGTRRKKIKNKLSEKMKDEEYKKEFERQLANQDMSKHQKAANRERKAQDTKNTIAKVGRGIKNIILGVGTTSVTAIALYNAAKMVGADEVIKSKAKQALSKVQNYVNQR